MISLDFFTRSKITRTTDVWWCLYCNSLFVRLLFPASFSVWNFLRHLPDQSTRVRDWQDIRRQSFLQNNRKVRMALKPKAEPCTQRLAPSRTGQLLDSLDSRMKAGLLMTNIVDFSHWLFLNNSWYACEQWPNLRVIIGICWGCYIMLYYISPKSEKFRGTELNEETTHRSYIKSFGSETPKHHQPTEIIMDSHGPTVSGGGHKHAVAWTFQ